MAYGLHSPSGRDERGVACCRHRRNARGVCRAPAQLLRAAGTYRIILSDLSHVYDGLSLNIEWPWADYLLKRCLACCPKFLWPRTIIATKTKRTLLSRVIVAVVAFLRPLFLYQNAAVLYLNVDVAIFCTKEIWDQPKNHGDFRSTSRKSPYHKRGCFLHPS